MPHVIVKLVSGKTKAQKQDLTRKVIDAIKNALDYDDASISVALEEIAADDWKEKVYETDIQNGAGKIYKAPGYNM